MKPMLRTAYLDVRWTKAKKKESKMDLVKTYEKTEKEIYLNDATAESFKVSLLDGVVTIRNKKVRDDRFRKCFDMDEKEFLQFTQIVKQNLLSHLTSDEADAAHGLSRR